MHAFSECGPAHNKLLLEGAFPGLVRALQETDIAQHAHPQVLLVFFEISHRYIKHLSKEAILRVFLVMLGRRGVLHSDSLVRGRAAYYILKICESQEGRAANMLEAVYPQLSGSSTLLHSNPSCLCVSSLVVYLLCVDVCVCVIFASIDRTSLWMPLAALFRA